MSRIKKYVKERNRVLRLLDEDAYSRFCSEWGVPQPMAWLPLSRLILMHKVRLQVASMTEEEKAVSRQWLLSHGYSLDIKG